MNHPLVYDEAELDRTLRRAFEDPAIFQLPLGVFRHDYDSTHAWRVNITRDRAKFLEYFYDDVSGSIENGLRMAILYRHEVISSFPMTVSFEFKRAMAQEPELRIERKIDLDTKYEYWRAAWHDANYKRKTRSFSVRKFGEAGARELALEAATRNHNPVPKTYLQGDLHATPKWSSVPREEVYRNASRSHYGGGSHRPAQPVDTSYPFTYEGERRVQLHMAIERDRAFRNKKIEHFLAQNGTLGCELCHFNFQSTYPFLKRDIIEVHHTVPLSELKSATLIELADLMLLCSNCHTAIHQGDAAANLGAAKLQFRR
ncbi:MAG: HNH endonuclease [Rubrivivax sp.]|nr:HNH endonuclease [Rubrivivax sp.]